MSEKVKYMTLRGYLRRVGAGKVSRKEIRGMKNRLRTAAVNAPRQYTKEGRAKVRLYPETVFAAAVSPILEARKGAAKVAGAVVMAFALSGCQERMTPDLEALINFSVVCALVVLVLAAVIGYVIGSCVARWRAEEEMQMYRLALNSAVGELRRLMGRTREREEVSR